MDHALLYSEFKKRVKMEDDQQLKPGGLEMFIDTNHTNAGAVKKYVLNTG